MNKTSIEWTNYTSNPIRARNIETGKTGHFCEKITEGCAHCYASEWNENRYGTGLAFIPQNRESVEVYLDDRELQEWQKPKYAGKRVFVADMTDWAGEWVKDEWHERIFEAMGSAPHVTFQLLTKRAWEAWRIISRFEGKGWPLPNVWLGVSAENPEQADKRIPWLLNTPAAIRFISYEPALAPLDLKPRPRSDTCIRCGEGPAARHDHPDGYRTRGLDWVIAGGESGPSKYRRTFNPEWARSVRDQCRHAGVAFFMKQMGGGFPGASIEELPEDLRVREFPA